MTNLTDILNELQTSDLEQRFTRLIELHAEELNLDRIDEITQDLMINVIDKLIGNLNSLGFLIMPQYYNQSRFVKCFNFLEKYYSTAISRGYERALNEIQSNRSSALKKIIEECTKNLLLKKISQRLDCVYELKCKRINWKNKVELVNQIKVEFGQFLSDEMMQLPSPQLAPYLRELIEEIVLIINQYKENLLNSRTNY